MQSSRSCRGATGRLFFSRALWSHWSISFFPPLGTTVVSYGTEFWISHFNRKELAHVYWVKGMVRGWGEGRERRKGPSVSDELMGQPELNFQQLLNLCDVDQRRRWNSLINAVPSIETEPKPTFAAKDTICMCKNYYLFSAGQLA